MNIIHEIGRLAKKANPKGNMTNSIVIQAWDNASGKQMHQIVATVVDEHGREIIARSNDGIEETLKILEAEIGDG